MIKKFLAGLGLFLVIFAAVPATSMAWSPSTNVNCSGQAASSAFCTDVKNKKDPISGSDGNGLLIKVTNLIALIAGVTAVIIIILAGLRFVTSGGGSEDVAGARRTIIYALVGVVVIILARTLIIYILSKL